MIKVYGRCVYDTEKSTEVCRSTHSYFGDPCGYEEVLYRTEGGNCFVYAIGGEDSPYPHATIYRVAKSKVDAWLAGHR